MFESSVKCFKEKKIAHYLNGNKPIFMQNKKKRKFYEPTTRQNSQTFSRFSYQIVQYTKSYLNQDYLKVVLIKLKSKILEFAKFSKYFLQNAGEQVLLKLDYWQIDINCGINTPPLTRFRCSSSNLSKCERRMRLVQTSAFLM